MPAATPSKGFSVHSPIHRHLRRAVVVTTTVLALVGVTVPASRAGAASTRDLSGYTISVGDQQGVVRSPLTAAGLLDRVPYGLDWHSFGSGPPLVEALNAGSIDIGVVGDVPPVFAAAAGVDLVVIGALRTNPAGTSLVVTPDSPIRKVADLKGKKIAYGNGTAAQYFVTQLLKTAKLTLDDVESVNLQPVDARAAGTSGAVDAWVSFDPLTALDQSTDTVRVVDDAEGLTSGLLLVVAHGPSITEKKPAFRDFVNRVARSRVWAREHPTEFGQIWSSELKLPPEVLATVTARARAEPVPIDAEVIADVQRIADTFAAEGIIPSKVNVKRLFDRSFNNVLGKPLAQAPVASTTTVAPAP